MIIEVGDVDGCKTHGEQSWASLTATTEYDSGTLWLRITMRTEYFELDEGDTKDESTITVKIPNEAMCKWAKAILVVLEGKAG